MSMGLGHCPIGQYVKKVESSIICTSHARVALCLRIDGNVGTVDSSFDDELMQLGVPRLKHRNSFLATCTKTTHRRHAQVATHTSYVPLIKQF